MRQLDDITDLMDMSLSKFQELGWTGKPGVLQFMGSQRVRYDVETEQQQFSGDNSSLGRLNAEKFSSNPSCTVFKQNSFCL